MAGEQPRHTVVATFADLQGAREAMEALERGGIEAAQISVAGRPVEAAVQDPDPRARDAGVTKRLTGFSVAGAAAGLVLGAVAGLLIGWAVHGLESQALWTWVIGMAGVGLAIGGLVAPIAVLPQHPAWQDTFEKGAPAGRVRIGVVAPDEEDVRRATEILREHHPLRIERVDRGRRRSPAPM